MDAVLLDTDVFSYLMKPRETRGIAYRRVVENKTVAISFVTVGELYFGARKAGWKRELVEGLEQRLRSVVIIPSDNSLCFQYGTLKAQLKKSGNTVADNDLWIAACSVRHGIPLVSNNRKHFEKIPDLQLISLAPSEVAGGPRNLFSGLEEN